MKTKKLTKGTIGFVDFPNDATTFEVLNQPFKDEKLLYFLNPQRSIELEPGNWTILGESNSLTEEQLSEIMPKGEGSITYGVKPDDLTDFVESISCTGHPQWTKITRVFYQNFMAKQSPTQMCFVGDVPTALESYKSLKQELLICDENSYANEPELETTCCGNWCDSVHYPNIPQCCGVPIPTEESVHLHHLWKEAQSKVIKYITLYKED